MKRLGLLVLCIAASVVVSAADVSGKWTAQTAGMSGPETTTFDFRVDGENVTGTVTTPAAEYTIKEGTLRGDDLHFYITVKMGRDVKFIFNGKLTGEEIGFTREIEGMGRRSEFVAKRLN